MIPLIPTIVSLFTPVASKLINAYVTPKLLPVINKVSEIEKAYKDIDNDIKYDKLLAFIETTPHIKKFINKCGWDALEVDTVISFCVLMAKKPPTNAESREKWDYNDTKVLFDFARIIITKWINAFSKKG